MDGFLFATSGIIFSVIVAFIITYLCRILEKNTENSSEIRQDILPEEGTIRPRSTRPLPGDPNYPGRIGGAPTIFSILMGDRDVS